MVVFDDDIDLGSPKEGLGGMLPDGAVDSMISEAEPLLSPEELRSDYILVPTVSAMPDPVTGEYVRYTDDDLKRFIKRAVTAVELDLGIEVLAKRFDERQPYDQQEQMSFGYIQVNHRPIIKVHAMGIVNTSNKLIFGVPNDWIASGRMHQGQINILPYGVAMSASGGTMLPVVSASGMGLLPALFTQRWVEGMWGIVYEAGFPDGKIPSVVNQLVGAKAAMKVLSLLASTYARSNSASLGIDGLSQSTSGQGPELFNSRIKALQDEYDSGRKKVQRLYGLGIVVDNI